MTGLRVALIAALPMILAPQSAGVNQFEVASVKRVHDGPPPGDIPKNLDTAPGHLTMRNVPLRHALLWAYDLQDYQPIEMLVVGSASKSPIEN